MRSTGIFPHSELSDAKRCSSDAVSGSRFTTISLSRILFIELVCVFLSTQFVFLFHTRREEESNCKAKPVFICWWFSVYVYIVSIWFDCSSGLNIIEKFLPTFHLFETEPPLSVAHHSWAVIQQKCFTWIKCSRSRNKSQWEDRRSFYLAGLKKKRHLLIKQQIRCSTRAQSLPDESNCIIAESWWPQRKLAILFPSGFLKHDQLLEFDLTDAVLPCIAMEAKINRKQICLRYFFVKIISWLVEI